MPNMRLNKQEAVDLITYIGEESQRVLDKDNKVSEKLAHEGSQTSVSAAFTVGPSKPAGDVVAIMNAWVREAHPDAKVNAGYMTLVNVSSEDVMLANVESEAFEKVEVHEMAMVDGLMTMRELTGLVIPANGQIQFQPGGMHLMLMGPRQNLASGQQINMTLTFKSGIKQTVTVKVAAG